MFQGRVVCRQDPACRLWEGQTAGKVCLSAGSDEDMRVSQWFYVCECSFAPVRTTSFFTPSVVFGSSGRIVGPSYEGRTDDSLVTSPGLLSSFLWATSFSNATSGLFLAANCARCIKGTSCIDDDVAGALARHDAVLEVGFRVWDVVKGAIEAGLLGRPRAEALSSGLVVRSIVMGVR